MKKIDKSIIITAIISMGVGIALTILFIGITKTTNGHRTLEHAMNESQVGDEIWTCSMHPQIRQNEPGDCPICGMDLIPQTENASSDPMVLEMTDEAIKLANIQTTILGSDQNEEKKKLSLSGKIRADERLTSSQVSHVPGRIEKLYVSFTGEKVYKGQKLAELYSPELISAQRELLEAKELKAINPGLENAARKKLMYWKIGEELISEIEKNGKIRETFPLISDHTGIVNKRKISVGDYLKQGDAVFEIINLSKVWVLFDAYEEDLSFIKVGDRINFSTPSLPNQEFSTLVSFIDPLLNPTTRTVSIRTELKNSNNLLKPEMLVYGTLEHSSKNGTKINVPKSAVLWTGKRSVVYVRIPDIEIPSFEFREIELGESLGESYLVLEGLEGGEELVTYGNFAIDAAAQLNNQSSMMNRMIEGSEMEVKTELPDFSSSAPATFKDQLYSLARAYLDLKDAFVATDPVLAKSKADIFNGNLKNVEMKLLKGKAQMYWMDKLKALQAHSNKISEMEDVEEQRKQFDFLSQALIESLKAFTLISGELYVQHCPMAIGKGGADWISDQTQIRNPYFGDAMLKCGSVTDTISVYN